MRAVLRIARKDLLLRIRDRSAFVLGIAAPLLLAVVFNAIFGSLSDGEDLADLGFVNLVSTEMAQSVDATMAGLGESGTVVVTEAESESALRAMVEDGEIDAGIVYPDGLGDPTAADAPEIIVIGNADAPLGTIIAEGVAEGVATRTADTERAVTAALDTSDFDPGSIPGLAQAVATEPPVIEVGRLAEATNVLPAETYYSAGLAIFFVFFTVMFGILSLLDEERDGTLPRLQAAPIPAWSIVAAKVLTSMVLGVVSLTVVAVATSFLIGADWGDPVAVGALILAVVAAATSIVGVVYGIARTPDGAGNLSSVVAVVLGMLGGTFVPISGQGALGTLTKITPHYWFLDGLAQLADGDGIGAVVPSLLALLAFAAVFTFVGALLVRRRFA